MSEYQYWEFQAIDRRLTSEELAYVRSLSSRVQLTPTQASFVYHYSSLRTDPLDLLEKCFDAMLYIANWGSTRLAFRFPRAALDPAPLLKYTKPEEISVKTTREHIILDMSFHAEGGFGWIDGEGNLSPMLPLRGDILRGDLRTLYLAWLRVVADMAGLVADDGYDDLDDEADLDDDDDLDEDAAEDALYEDLRRIFEPPVPPGLGQLTPALEALVDFFGVDRDLIAAAAEASPSPTAVEDRFEEWVALLPETERNAWLVRVARGEALVDVQLAQRLRRLGSGPSTSVAEARRRSASELVGAAQAQKQRRQEEEHRAAEQARLARLEALAEREPVLWDRVQALIDQKQARAYDDAIKLLRELRELAEHRDRKAEFGQRIATIQGKYPNRPSLIGRIREAKLI